MKLDHSHISSILGSVPVDLRTENAELRVEIERLRAERDGLARMLADWCVSVKRNGTGWDDWDEAYKNASSRDTSPPSLRQLIDEAVRRMNAEWDSFEMGAAQTSVDDEYALLFKPILIEDVEK